jgi:mannosyltransferase
MSTKSSAISRQSRNLTVMLAGTIVVATLLRLLFLGRESFNIDEVLSIAYARNDWATFFKIIATTEANMAFYRLLVRIWLQFGDNEQFIRILSVLPAVATIPVIYWLGAHLFDRKVGLIAAALISVNAFHIRYAQMARSYSLLVLMVTLSSVFFARGMQRSSLKTWIGYVVTTVIGIYSHFFAVLVLASHLASLASLRPRDVPWRAVAVSSVIIGVLSLPLGVFMLAQTWQIAWIPHPSLYTILDPFFSLVGEGRKRLLLAYLVPCVIASWMATKAWRSSRTSREAWRYSFLFAWFFGPMVIALGISLRQAIFYDRYLIVCLPPLALLAAVGLSRLRNAWALTGALIVIIGLAMQPVLSFYAEPQNEDLRGATSYVLSHAQSGDAILFYLPILRIHFAYYRARLRRATRNPALFIVSDWRDVSPHFTRLWLFLNHDGVTESDEATTRAIQATLFKKYTSVEDQKFSWVRVRLFSMLRGAGSPSSMTLAPKTSSGSIPFVHPFGGAATTALAAFMQLLTRPVVLAVAALLAAFMAGHDHTPMLVSSIKEIGVRNVLGTVGEARLAALPAQKFPGVVPSGSDKGRPTPSPPDSDPTVGVEGHL